MQSRCGEEAFVEKRGKSARGQGERDRGEEGAWTSGLETRVMAFLVLGCVRTLTLLAHIRAWSWLLSDFLHGAAASCACAPLFSRPISLRFCLPAPEKPDLRPNYPNPFAFSLPLSAHCRSTIKLDRRSKRIFFFFFYVKTLVSCFQSSLNRNCDWWELYDEIVSRFISISFIL